MSTPLGLFPFPVPDPEARLKTERARLAVQWLRSLADGVEMGAVDVQAGGLSEATAAVAAPGRAVYVMTITFDGPNAGAPGVWRLAEAAAKNVGQS